MCPSKGGGGGNTDYSVFLSTFLSFLLSSLPLFKKSVESESSLGMTVGGGSGGVFKPL